ncbi:zinc ribbon domain-containing protein [Synechococcus sp. CS-1328]|uniref:zinc ribbon domain-containing protein n=1 Tax=Synechococcus sp. CS-1328 TaxID=2847976 RepID=UPI00223A7CFC|nr:zinc ribbon domain-containing protein [Synechococcus sp. CS-1328]MCT0226018.1 hypothetical protein [Synechococcus sp. CS-1328]
MNPQRGPERLIRLGQWVVTLLFAYFLIQVGASLIADLPLLSRQPQPDDFLDRAVIERLQQEIRPTEARMERIRSQLSAVQAELQAADQSYARARTSFENWRAARSTTEQADQNPAVLQRAAELDRQLKRQDDIQERLGSLQQQEAGFRLAIQPQQEQISELRTQADQRYQRARQWAELRAFLIRLLFVLPVLALALWQFRLYRTSDQWPFVWGFLLFALFAFFFELVPYLPSSFGSYIRYGIGALLTYLGGRALIQALRSYAARKQAELEASQEERRLQIRYEQAMQALGRHQCPSCERALPKLAPEVLSYCSYCGLNLAMECPRCKLRHTTFFPYCPSCGLEAEQAAAVATGNAGTPPLDLPTP